MLDRENIQIYLNERPTRVFCNDPFTYLDDPKLNTCQTRLIFKVELS